MRKIILLLLSFNIYYSVHSQFNWEATIDSIQKDSYYKILLPPEINGKLKNDFSDIRIFDNEEKEIPYLIMSEKPVSYITLFKEYEIAKKIITKNCCTELMLHNVLKSKINNVHLVIKNAEVSKSAKLSGSDDGNEWFVLKEKFFLQSINNANETAEIKLLNFPLTNYKFLKLEIVDSTSAPLNILKAGYYDTNSEKAKYSEIPLQSIKQTDSTSLKKTFLRLNFGQQQYIDMIEIDVEQPNLYLRRGSICQETEVKIKKQKTDTVLTKIHDFELNSKEENIISFSNFPAKELILIIENADNYPLKFKSIKAWQIAHYLVGDLRQGKKYSLRFGHEKIYAPDYDLKYFQDSIPKDLSTINTIGLKNIRKKEEVRTTSFFKSTLAIWFAIGAVLVLLGLMSVKIVRDLGKK